MNLNILRHSFVALVILFSCNQRVEQSSHEPGNEITFRENAADQRVDVLIDGALFTSYQWPDSVYKPVLYPIISSGGTTVTRGFPLEPREGERNDHRHQVGNWLNYGNVNGYDFWGNGHSGEKLPNGGVIEHKSIDKVSEGSGQASLTTSAVWRDPDGKELLSETTRFHFHSRDTVRLIDRITTLTASGGVDVAFTDTKEGMFGLRLARELELPTNNKVVLMDASGRELAPDQINNYKATGDYRSSEGIKGEDVWGTRAKWMNLHGAIGDEEISIVMCDHPKNISYPTWWHARGYGLFSANPLGAKDFTKGKEELNYTLSSGDSVTFRYRIIIASGALSDEDIERLSNEFTNQY